MSNIKKPALLVFIGIAVVIALMKPFAGLAPQGHYIGALTLVCLAMWVFKADSTPYLSGITILLAGGLIFKLPLATVTSGYTSSAVWVLIPALFFGFALVKTGLGKRVAYFVLTKFEPSYLTICVSWFIIGIILSALTPSITVRLAIVMPIAMSLVEACKIHDKSKGSALICLTAWGTAILPGIGWQTGSLWGILMMGFYPTAMKVLVTPGTWFAYMAVPWMLITILFLILVYIFFKPEEPLRLSRQAFKEQYGAMGRITRQEIMCGGILICAFVLFSTEKWTGVTTPMTALLTLAALIAVGIVKVSDISSGVNWDIINFLAVVMSLTAMFVSAGISGWAGPLIEPAVLTLAGSPLMFLLVVTVVFWAIRFIDVPWGYTTVALFSPVFIPLYEKLGIHPVLVSVAIIAAGNSFFLAYQQPFIMIGDTMTKSRGWSGGQVALAGALYGVAVIMGILLSYPYWKMMGLLPG
ncbi:MAG: tricarboxylate transporter [Syntrophus sp. (in: bacteria)]|nr:tricarboxylate transporter [Syntrophus sp. (in: bacteria)]